jgi:hypothetical protein
MIRYAQIIAVHPERRTVDVAMSDTGERIGEVDVLSGSVSSDAGEWDIPDVTRPSTEAAAGGLAGGGRVVMACIDFTSSGRAVVIGFTHPAGGQMNFKQANRKISRHPSGAYTTIAPDGSIEHYHPSGAYLRIGTGAHEDLTPISADGNWTIPSGAPASQITLVTSGFTLTVEPGGKTTLTSQGDATLNYQGNVTVQAGGNLSLIAGGDLTLQAAGGMSVTGEGGISAASGATTPTTITGAPLTINGHPVTPGSSVIP